jgi:DNA adenine methylase
VSFLRYPGGKAKLAKRIVENLNKLAVNVDLEYREPFVGAGGITTEFLTKNPHITKIWINDKDQGMAALWDCVIHNPGSLKDEVRDFEPSIEHFDTYKKLLLDPNAKLTNIQRGFMKLAIHQISYSGLGTKSGGPLGGRDQKSAYKIDCRWSPRYICTKIDKFHKIFSNVKIQCTSLDFEDIICKNGNAIIYLDPPYYVKGNDLYQEGFSKADHRRLADSLAKTKHRWLLSYDDCPAIRDLYDWALVESIDTVNYSITATKEKGTGVRKSRAKPELLISRH